MWSETEISSRMGPRYLRRADDPILACGLYATGRVPARGDGDAPLDRDHRRRRGEKRGEERRVRLERALVLGPVGGRRSAQRGDHTARAALADDRREHRGPALWDREPQR